MGLDGGDANFSYIAPASAAIRVGMTDNIETRAMFLGATKLSTDLFFHTHYDSSQINYGISVGTRFDHRIFGKKTDDKPTVYSTVTISKQIKRFTPYLSLSYETDEEIGHSFTIGSEYILYKSSENNFKIHIIPELNYYLNPKGFLDNKEITYFGGSLGIGFSFDLL